MEVGTNYQRGETKRMAIFYVSPLYPQKGSGFMSVWSKWRSDMVISRRFRCASDAFQGNYRGIQGSLRFVLEFKPIQRRFERLKGCFRGIQ